MPLSLKLDIPRVRLKNSHQERQLGSWEDACQMAGAGKGDCSSGPTSGNSYLHRLLLWLINYLTCVMLRAEVSKTTVCHIMMVQSQQAWVNITSISKFSSLTYLKSLEQCVCMLTILLKINLAKIQIFPNKK